MFRFDFIHDDIEFNSKQVIRYLPLFIFVVGAYNTKEIVHSFSVLTGLLFQIYAGEAGAYS